jgi:hypothetical protein
MFRLKTRTEPGHRNFVFLIKDRTMNNVQICDSYINERYFVAFRAQISPSGGKERCGEGDEL